MAWSDAYPPGTAGSQFFVVLGVDIGLMPDYAIVGEVTEGMETIDRIAALGGPGDGPPTKPIVISSVTVG
jgi:cyclophilin family peptidyl-prolyl cis-trans isomerase